MRSQLNLALQALIINDWHNREYGSIADGGTYTAMIDATTEREMMADVLEDIDGYDGAPTIDDVPAAWYVVTEYDDGTADIVSRPTESAAMVVFRDATGYDGI